MSRRITLILAGFGLAATAAQGQEAASQPQDPAPELKALADSCAAHKFETMVVTDGSGRAKKVKICGKEGQSDADWLVTLRDSARKVEADEAMEQAVKDQILSALHEEIGRLESEAAAATPPPVATVTLEAMPATTIAVGAAPVVVPEAAPQYSSVPALPAPRPRAVGAQAKATAGPVVRPRLTLRCALPTDRFAACANLERETRLLIRADEDMASGTSLRFLRGGNARAELDVGALKKGDVLREKLPGRVCAGVLRGKVEVQVLSKNQVAETLGPWPLYCGS